MGPGKSNAHVRGLRFLPTSARGSAGAMTEGGQRRAFAAQVLLPWHSLPPLVRLNEETSARALDTCLETRIQLRLQLR